MLNALRNVLLIILLGVLAACASQPRTDNEALLERGAEAWRSEDYGTAVALLQQAAARGSARAQYAIGYMYYNGQGVTQDVDKALVWIRRAADNGDERAIHALGAIADGVSRQRPPRPPDAPPASGDSPKE